MLIIQTADLKFPQVFRRLHNQNSMAKHDKASEESRLEDLSRKDQG